MQHACTARWLEYDVHLCVVCGWRVVEDYLSVAYNETSK